MNPFARMATAPRLRWAYVLFAGAAMGAIALASPIAAFWRGGIQGIARMLPYWTHYNVVVLSSNYLDAGWVRRGLGGTIAALLSSEPYHAGLAFHALSAALLIVPLILLQLRTLKEVSLAVALLLAGFIVVSPQTFWGWSNDIARTDLIVGASIAWSAWALLRDRPGLAAALLFLGGQIHETALIFGVPLAVVLSASRVKQSGSTYRHHALALGALIVASGAMALLSVLLGPDGATLASVMRAHAPPAAESWYDDLRDCAIYMLVSGFRGVRTAMCYNADYAAYPLMVLCAVGIAVLNVAVLGLERRPLACVLAVLLPLLFMEIVASDTGRWVKLAALNSWLLAVAFHGSGQLSLARWRPALSVALLVLLMGGGGSRVHHPNPASAKVAAWLGFSEAAEVAEWMDRCDPEWRSIARR